MRLNLKQTSFAAGQILVSVRIGDGLLGAPARMAQAPAPLIFGLLIDWMGSRVLIVSSALSLLALLALFGLLGAVIVATAGPAALDWLRRHGVMPPVL